MFVAMNLPGWSVLSAALFTLSASPLYAADHQSAGCPVSTESALHDGGGIWATLGADGLLGMEETLEGLGPGLLLPEENVETLYMAALWIGAKGSAGTARVTTGHDGWWRGQEELRVLTDDAPVHRRDTRFTTSLGTRLSDRFEACEWSREQHAPLGVDVDMALVGPRDLSSPFLLLFCRLHNRSQNALRDLYCGLYWDGDIGPAPTSVYEALNNSLDDITGFRRFDDGRGGFLEMAFIADAEHPDPGIGDGVLVPSGIGVAHLPTSADNPYLEWGANYNWWLPDADPALDWGPGTPFPDGSDGTPDGDANKYRLLSDWAADGPDPDLLAVADPNDARFLLSFREPDLAPGESRLVVFAIAAAEVWQGQNLVTDGLEETIREAREFLDYVLPGGAGSVAR